MGATNYNGFDDQNDCPIQVRFGTAGITVSGQGKVAKDFEVTDSTKGLLLKSPNGHRWRLQVTNAGALVLLDLDA